MTRAQLEHLIRAAADIANDEDIVVIGSQAILGQFPDAPESMRISEAIAGREKDIDFLNDAARYGLAQPDELLGRLASVNTDSATIERAKALVRRIFA